VYIVNPIVLVIPRRWLTHSEWCRMKNMWIIAFDLDNQQISAHSYQLATHHSGYTAETLLTIPKLIVMCLILVVTTIPINADAEICSIIFVELAHRRSDNVCGLVSSRWGGWMPAADTIAYDHHRDASGWRVESPQTSQWQWQGWWAGRILMFGRGFYRMHEH